MKTRREMTERESADHKTGHDLVADAEIDRRIEHLVRQRDRRRQRDHVAREERQFHSRFTLGDAIAHRRDTARHLGDGAHFARRFADEAGIASRRADAPTACHCRR